MRHGKRCKSDDSLLTIHKKITDAIALVSEVDSTFQYDNETLYTYYSKDWSERHGLFTSFTDSLKVDRASTAYWMDTTSPAEAQSSNVLPA